MSGTLLKLRAQDREDVEVISAVLQDAIVPVCDMAFEPDTESFILVAQRLRRETGADAACERICCAMTIRGVNAVHRAGFDRADGERMLDLLALILDPDGKCLDLIFAGNARIRLDLGSWRALAEDFGEPWPALCNPCHDDVAAKSAQKA